MEIYKLKLKYRAGAISSGITIEVPGEGGWNSNYIIDALRKNYDFKESDIRDANNTALWEAVGVIRDQRKAVALENELRRYSRPK